jgi:hypothetical protein
MLDQSLTLGFRRVGRDEDVGGIADGVDPQEDQEGHRQNEEDALEEPPYDEH